MKRPQINTILFDMDGVVIDSEKLHIRAMGMTLDKFGIPYPESLLDEFVGKSDTSFFEYIYNNIDSRIGIEEMLSNKNIFFEELMVELLHVEGFDKFISFVKENSFQKALVTSSSLFTVNKVDKLLNIKHHFDIVITEEDTRRHKPDPEPYLLALSRFNADNSNTLVIEDSISGVIAGKAAGCMVAGITTSFEKGVLLDAGADFVVDRFDEITFYINY
jgi:beta-phosphoglucomutase-like phosphatase (HAD superfamily)